MVDLEKEINNFDNFISKYIKKDKINHAYLLETNSNNKVELAEQIVKKILMLDKSISLEELKLYNDLIVIQTELNTIKTEEIETMKEKLITTSVNGSKRFYIINEAEKLNDYAANKLLKFIEEPEGDIVAILTTENKNNVIKTILSRCQILRYIVKEDKLNNYDEEYIDSLFDFVINIEENKEQAIAFQNKYDIKKLSDRKYIKEFLNNLLYIYDDVIQYKINSKVEYFPNKKDLIKEISEKNDIVTIKNKIKAINNCIDRLKYNPNIKLLIDKIIILMSGVDLDA